MSASSPMDHHRRPAILVSSGTCHRLPITEMLALVAATGADGVELLIGPEMDHFGEVQLAYWFESFAGRRHIHTPFYFAEDPQPRRRAEARRIADLARWINADLLVVHPPVFADLAVTTEECRQTVDALREGLDPACVVTLENLPLPKGDDIPHTLSSADTVADLAQRCGARVTLDTTHLATTGAPLLETHKRLGDRVVNVHLSDYANWQQHLFPGTGSLPLREYLAWIGTLRAQPDITVETAPQHAADESAETLLRVLTDAVAFVRDGLQGTSL